MPSPSTAAAAKSRQSESVNLEATIKIELPKRAASPSLGATAPRAEPQTAPGQDPAAIERRVSPQRAAIGQRMAILMEQESFAREAERRRTRRWLIGGTALLVSLIAVPLMFSAMSGKKPAASGKPATERAAPAK